MTDIKPEQVTVLAFKRNDSHYDNPVEPRNLLEATHLQDSNGNNDTMELQLATPPIAPDLATKTDICSKVSLVLEDITTLDSDCIVNAAKSTLDGGSGVDLAIHTAAGSDLREYCVNTYGFCNVGEAVITPSFDLSEKNKKSIKFICFNTKLLLQIVK